MELPYKLRMTIRDNTSFAAQEVKITEAVEPIVKQSAVLAQRLMDGHSYLMGVSQDALTVEAALEAFGYNKNGLEE